MDLGAVESLAYAYPELILAGVATLIFLADLVVRAKERLGVLALFGCAFALVASIGLRVPLTDTWLVQGLFGWNEGWLFSRMVVVDDFAVFFKVVLSLAAFATVWMSLGSNEVRESSEGEYYGLVLSSAVGMLYMASAANLLMAYLALEFVSITSYVLTGYLRRNRRSGEAALKYLIYGGVASGTMIYGMSWLYGMAGSLDYARINAALAAGGAEPLTVFIAVVLILAGFGYKIAAVPFHMWAPDAYHGAPIPVTAFLSVGSKAAGFAILIRLFYPGLSQAVEGGEWRFLAGVEWPQLMLVISMATMTLGNLAAINQQNLKRLLAYSSIAHAGYTLMGFVVLSDEGLRAMLFYLVTYYLMNLGAFLVVMVVANSTGREDIDGFRGLAWRGGAVPAVAMAIFLFSLAGLPPLAGFIGKFYLFAAVVKEQLYLLALVGLANSVVALYYYARIVRTMFLDMPAGDEGVVTLDSHNAFLLYFLALPTVVLGVYWAPVIDLAGRSVRFFTG
jgi:NADH-quinone oxidoreductase subunit N